MNLFKRELKANAKSLFFWCLGMAFLIWAGMVKYDAFRKTGDEINRMLAQLPPALIQTMGLGNGADLTSVAVFYSIFFLFFMLLGAVHAGMLGALILAKEERDKTADFLFVKPIRRRRAILMKLLAAIVNIVILDLVTFGVSVFSVERYNTTGQSLAFPIFLMILALFLLQLLFLGVGFLAAAAAKTAKTASGAVSVFILGTYILSVVIDLNDDLSFLGIFSPFRYFDADSVMFDHYLSPGYSALSLILAAACALGTLKLFGRRDLRG